MRTCLYMCMLIVVQRPSYLASLAAALKQTCSFELLLRVTLAALRNRILFGVVGRRDIPDNLGLFGLLRTFMYVWLCPRNLEFI